MSDYDDLLFALTKVAIKDQIVTKHKGPGNHPDGSSQKVHGKKKPRKSKATTLEGKLLLDSWESYDKPGGFKIAKPAKQDGGVRDWLRENQKELLIGTAVAAALTLGGIVAYRKFNAAEASSFIDGIPRDDPRLGAVAAKADKAGLLQPGRMKRAAYKHLEGKDYVETTENFRLFFADAKIEHGILIKDNGKIVKGWRGTAGSVEFDEVEIGLMQSGGWKGMHFVHNHPVFGAAKDLGLGKDASTSLSGPDLTTAIASDLATMTATTPHGTYTMKMGSDYGKAKGLAGYMLVTESEAFMDGNAGWASAQARLNNFAMGRSLDDTSKVPLPDLSAELTDAEEAAQDAWDEMADKYADPNDPWALSGDHTEMIAGESMFWKKPEMSHWLADIHTRNASLPKALPEVFESYTFTPAKGAEYTPRMDALTPEWGTRPFWRTIGGGGVNQLTLAKEMGVDPTEDYDGLMTEFRAFINDRIKNAPDAVKKEYIAKHGDHDQKTHGRKGPSKPKPAREGGRIRGFLSRNGIKNDDDLSWQEGALIASGVVIGTGAGLAIGLRTARVKEALESAQTGVYETDRYYRARASTDGLSAYDDFRIIDREAGIAHAIREGKELEVRQWLDIYEGDLGNGYVSKAAVSLQANSPEGQWWMVEGSIYAADGKFAGSFQRSIITEGDYTKVKHDWLAMKPDHMGSGAGNAFYERSIVGYKKYGNVDEVGVSTAAIGGYNWAMQGYQWSEGKMPTYMRQMLEQESNQTLNDKRIREEIKTLLTRDAAGELVTPREVAEIGKSYAREVSLPDKPETKISMHAGKALMIGQGWSGTLPISEAGAEKYAKTVAQAKTVGDRTRKWIQKQPQMDPKLIGQLDRANAWDLELDGWNYVQRGGVGYHIPPEGSTLLPTGRIQKPAGVPNRLNGSSGQQAAAEARAQGDARRAARSSEALDTGPSATARIKDMIDNGRVNRQFMKDKIQAMPSGQELGVGLGYGVDDLFRPEEARDLLGLKLTEDGYWVRKNGEPIEKHLIGRHNQKSHARRDHKKQESYLLNRDVKRWLTDEHEGGPVGSGIAYIRSAYERNKTKTALGRLFDAKATNTEGILYRGLASNDARLQQPGAVLEFGLSSFSSSPKVAFEFAKKRARNGEQAAVIRMAPGARGLDISPYYNSYTDTFRLHRRKKEYIVKGKARVSHTYKSNGITVIEVKPYVRKKASA